MTDYGNTQPASLSDIPQTPRQAIRTTADRVAIGHLPIFTIEVVAYPLERADFLILRSCAAKALSLAIAAASATAGMAVPIVARAIDARISNTEFNLTSLEGVSVAVPLGITLISFVVGLALPNERRRLCATISRHFADNPSRAKRDEGP